MAGLALTAAGAQPPTVDPLGRMGPDDMPSQHVIVQANRWLAPTLLPPSGELEPANSTVSLVELPSKVLTAPGNGSLSAVLAALPSVGENYAAVGYYENFTIRGFTLDMGSAFRVNGMVVPGEWQLPLEGTSSLQVAAGMAGTGGGLVGGGGTINQVTPRGGQPMRARYEADNHGSMLLALNGGRGGTTWAWHATASAAQMRPPYPAADGHRRFLGLAVDFVPDDSIRLFLDIALQRRSQPVVPGFQLLGGTALPDLSLRGVNLNAQPWSRPVTNNGALGMLRAEGAGAGGLRWEAGLSHAVARIDDNLATPYGCNSPPFEFFCSNGDYVLYDYHASERRSTTHLRASATLPVKAAGLTHQLQAGLEYIDRQVVQRDVYSSTLYDDTGLALSGNIFRSEAALPMPSTVGADRPTMARVQKALALGHSMAAGQWSSTLGMRWVEIEASGIQPSERHALPRWALSWHLDSMHELFASAARAIEFGSEAPATAANAGALLAPRVAKQFEAGWKGGHGGALRYGLTAFQSERPWEFVEPAGESWAGRGSWVQRGRQRHTGVEATIAWDLAPTSRLEGRLTHIDAIGAGSGLAGWDGKQLQNIPKTGLYVRLEQEMAWLPGLSYNAALTARSSKSATADGSVRVGGYGVLDLGLSGKMPLWSSQVSMNFGVRNATDRRYWRDSGQAYSADLLFPGTARMVFLTLRVGESG